MSKVALKSTRITTGTTSQRIDGYVLITDDTIEAVLEKGMIDSLKLKDYEVEDYGDFPILPGFCDFHVHLVNTATILRDGDLRSTRSEEEAAKTLWEIHKNGEPRKVIMGGAWDNVLWGQKNPPRKETLDKYFPETPVFLLNNECHSAWVNSKALELFHITKDTPDPPHGYFHRDEEGNPTGFLHEEAVFTLQDRIFEMMDEEEIGNYAKSFIEEANRYGITSLGDVVGVSGVNYKAYQHLLDMNQLNARIFFYLEFEKEVEEIQKVMAHYSGSMLKCNGVKAFIDGTPQGYTGYMLEEYTDCKGETSFPLHQPEDLFEKVCAFDQEGIQVRIHACGDAGVRLCLDAYENAIKVNGTDNRRHCIEHIEAISPEDIPRFGKLGVVASIQPEHLPKYVFEDHPFHRILGEERMKYCWPIGSILKSGGPLVFGTDSPVAPLNPTRGLYRAVNRLTNYGTPKGGWNPWDRISMQEAVSAYTQGGAYAAHMDKEIGTLEPGKKADITVLEKDVFENQQNLEVMLDVKAVMTMVNGKTVYRKQEEK